MISILEIYITTASFAITLTEKCFKAMLLKGNIILHQDHEIILPNQLKIFGYLYGFIFYLLIK